MDLKDKDNQKFIFPKNCPSCGLKIKEFSDNKKNDAVRRCREGYECENVIEKIKHFVSKDAFNIDGFGKKIVKNFGN